jgi:hypothetical protein
MIWSFKKINYLAPVKNKTNDSFIGDSVMALAQQNH